MEPEYIKCSGCKCLRHSVDEFEIYKGTRRKNCLKCKEKRNKYKCEHGKQKSQCKECGGGSICEHGKRKDRCKDCGGSSFCEHGKRKTLCKECWGTDFCQHDKQKHHCKECGGGSICEHNHLRNTCVECGGSSLCVHRCEKRHCKECDPSGYLKRIVSCRVREALKADKSKKSIEYLGCSIEQFKEHIGFQFETGMSWDNYGEIWHIDHIIPIKYKQDGKEPSLEDTIKRLHWSNTQPMFAEENISKGNKFIGKISDYDKTIKEMCLMYNCSLWTL
jgi:hypothetical protein